MIIEPIVKRLEGELLERPAAVRKGCPPRGAMPVLGNFLEGDPALPAGEEVRDRRRVGDPTLVYAIGLLGEIPSWWLTSAGFPYARSD
jgi:hypothetical protein